MHRVGAGARSGIDQPIDPEVAVARRACSDRVRFVGQADVQRRAVALRVDRNGRDAHLAARTDDANGDFAAIGDQDFFHVAKLSTTAWWRFLFYRYRSGGVAAGGCR